MEESAAYTGEISPGMILDAGCTYVIIGHTERRQYFHETEEIINKKVTAALKNHLIPILCVGETWEERKQGRTFLVLNQQILFGLQGIDNEKLSSIIVAYEPVWAIGTGRTATPMVAADAHAFIRSQARHAFGLDASENLRILYGGSVKPENAKELRAQDEIDGALVGGADDGGPVLLGKAGGKGDLDPDVGNELRVGVALPGHRDGHPLGGDLPLLAEPQRVEPGAGADRGQEELFGVPAVADASEGDVGGTGQGADPVRGHLVVAAVGAVAGGGAAVPGGPGQAEGVVVVVMAHAGEYASRAACNNAAGGTGGVVGCGAP